MPKLKRINLILVVSLSFCLGACGTESSNKKEDAESLLVGPTTEVEIYNSIFTIQENWFVEDMGDMKCLYLQNEKSDEPNNVVFITRAKDVLENTKEWTSAEWYLSEVKDSLVEQGKIEKNYTEESFEKKETPVIVLNGNYPGTTLNTVIYLLMNDYSDLLIIQYVSKPITGEKDYFDEVHEIVNNLELSYDGFQKATPTPETNSGTSSDKKACDGEPYGAGSDWAKYDKNGDGCINDSEFQAGMGDAIENKVNGTSSGSDTSDRTGLCEFKENGKYICNKKAMSGYSFCKEHWELLNNAYNSLVGN